jgi:hypothetical protein
MQRFSGGGLTRRLVVAGAVAAALLLVMGGVALSRVWLGRRESPAATVISVPAGATTRVDRRGRFRLSLRGPGAVEIPGEGDSLRLEQGNLQVESQSRAVTVETTGRQVEISPSSTVTLDVPGPGKLEISTAAGAEPRIDGRAAPHVAPVVPAPVVAPAPAAVMRPEIPPVEAPRPHSAASIAVAAPPVATEVGQLHDAIERLRTQGDPSGALRRLDDHDRRFPRGLLHDEAAAMRVEALLALGRSAEALDRLEAIPQDLVDRSPRLLVARGELRASQGRCRDALVDFDRLLAHSGPGEIVRRATRGRAACLGLRDERDAPL